MKLIFGVDDSNMNRIIVQEAASVLKVDSLTASDGVEGLKLLNELLEKDRLPKVIVTDIIMPNMGGIELIENIKKNDKLKYIPIIVLTTEQDFRLMEKSKSLGATGWIEKPVLPDE